MYGSWRAEDDIVIITLENLFTIDLYNDMCMLARERCIVLTEHQSSINENMPTRLLLYIAEEYKRLFSGEKTNCWQICQNTRKKNDQKNRTQILKTHNETVRELEIYVSSSLYYRSIYP